MRALLQRVKWASVSIDSKEHSKIGHGLCILLGVQHEDTSEDVQYLADKCMGLRIFSDAEDKMNLSVQDVAGEILIVSQFTLYGDSRKGKRPSFTKAARPDHATKLYEQFIEVCKQTGLSVQTGVFGADMQVSLRNDGPVTLWLDTEEMRGKEQT